MDPRRDGYEATLQAWYDANNSRLGPSPPPGSNGMSFLAYVGKDADARIKELSDAMIDARDSLQAMTNAVKIAIKMEELIGKIVSGGWEPMLHGELGITRQLFRDAIGRRR